MKKSIGLNVPVDEFKKVFTKRTFQVSEYIIFSGEVPKENKWELEETTYFREKDGELEKDPFADDISLYIPLKEGLLILTGCAHSGIINIIRYGFEVTHTEKLYGIIGGMHLKNASENRIERTL
jgi:7,8-dihydropterin-6-yl-methyl-4-(beta-D-ribofuranosyl)aminobenzene 5'-phosphate synthase